MNHVKLINEEYSASKEYEFETLKYKRKTTKGETEIEIVKLTRKNVALAEAMIHNDFQYRDAADPAKKPIEGKYNGSSAYWANKLKPCLENKVFDSEFEKAIKYFVEAIDRENSTHLNADNVGREQITQRLIDNKEHLYEWLRNPEDSNYKIIEVIKKKTTPKENSNKKGRENLSFASKFAHYACFYMFNGEEVQDNFSIYDGVLKDSLFKYFGAYNLDAADYPGYSTGNYQQYQKAIDDIRHNGDELLSRNGFDQLLWYYHKGRNECVEDGEAANISLPFPTFFVRSTGKGTEIKYSIKHEILNSIPYYILTMETGIPASAVTIAL